MNAEPREKPMRSVPDWRVSMPMAWACPRCGARTRSARPCRGPAMANGRCRMHGGRSTGPSADGRKKISETRMIHGGYSAVMRELRRALADERRFARRILNWALEKPLSNP